MPQREKTEAETQPSKSPETATAPEETEKPPTGPVKAAEGKIADESCSRFEIYLTVANGAKQLKLHARNYAKVEFWTDGWAAPANFNPCVDLKGIVVRVSFTSADGAETDGEIQKIEVLRQPVSKP